MSCAMKEEEWGWKLSNGVYVPITSDMEPAPPELLDIIKCKCKLESGRLPCSSLVCSCRKHGLPCISACKNCIGELCTNLREQSVPVIDPFDEGYEDEPTVCSKSSGDELAIDDLTLWDIPWLDEEVVEFC